MGAISEIQLGEGSGRLHGANPRGASALVLHIHGGAFTCGSPNESDGMAKLLAEAGATVFSAAYPLAPSHPFPAATNHLYALLKRVAAMRGRWSPKKAPLVIAGEEAGGNLAASVAMMARDQHEPDLSGQILIGPMLDACLGTHSMREADGGPVGCRWADGWSSYLGSAQNGSHPYASPGNAVRLAGLAPALIVTAADDPMRDESASYAKRLQTAGVPTIGAEVPGPTQWPYALCGEALDQQPWAKALREQFTSFFEKLRTGPPENSWGHVASAIA